MYQRHLSQYLIQSNKLYQLVNSSHKCEAVGIRDVLAKSLGSNNHANVVKATIEALSKLRPREEIFRVRGIQMKPTKAEAATELAPA